MSTKILNMPSNLNILITNDDGYTSKGLRELVEIMRPYGKVTVIAPKTHQSGMSVAVSIGGRILAYKKVGEEDGVSWAYLEGTPASCVKFALDKVFPDRKCDVVLSGINHGSNASVATNYSGTMGAAEEAAINGIPGIGVSLSEYGDDADFSKVKEYFPALFEKIMDNLPERRGISYNINFPPSEVEIKGVRVCHEGLGFWTEELEPFGRSLTEAEGRSLSHVDEPGRDDGVLLFLMRGRFVDASPKDDRESDHHAVEDGYIAITPQTMDRTDYAEKDRISPLMDVDF